MTKKVTARTVLDCHGMVIQNIGSIQYIALPTGWTEVTQDVFLNPSGAWQRAFVSPSSDLIFAQVQYSGQPLAEDITAVVRKQFAPPMRTLFDESTGQSDQV